MTAKHQPYLGKCTDVKFDIKFVPQILSGKKTSTMRLKGLGTRRDYFKVEDRTYVFHCVESAPLWCFMDIGMYKQEGFSSSEELFSELKAFYPDITLDTMVFCHCFHEEADHV